MNEIVPLSNVKEIEFQIFNEAGFFRYDTDVLTAEQEALINKHIELRLYFGFHGTEADHYLEVEKAFDDFDPSNTLLCFESAAFSVHEESEALSIAATAPVSERMRMQREAVLRSRNSHRQNYLASMNSFTYARGFCVANGYDVRFVDIDKWADRHWATYMKEWADADNNPILSEQVTDFMQTGWLKYDLIDAVEEWRKMQVDSTVILDAGDYPFVVYRWAEYHRIREEAVVRKLKSLALEEATRLEANEQNGDTVSPMKIALFFGSGHAHGIQARLNNLGIRHQAVYMSDLQSMDSASDMPITGNTAKGFMKSWIINRIYELFGPTYKPDEMQTLYDRVDATVNACNQVSLGSLCELYEAYRKFYIWHSEQTEPTTTLARALRDRQKQKSPPSAVFESLINSMFSQNGMNISKIIDSYTRQRKSATDQLFGMA